MQSDEIKNVKPLLQQHSVSGCKILAFESGGDWADASVDYMVNISGRSGEELFEEYRGNGGYHGNGKKWFKEWTIAKGYCREGSDDEIEVVSVVAGFGGAKTNQLKKEKE